MVDEQVQGRRMRKFGRVAKAAIASVIGFERRFDNCSDHSRRKIGAVAAE